MFYLLWQHMKAMHGAMHDSNLLKALQFICAEATQALLKLTSLLRRQTEVFISFSSALKRRAILKSLFRIVEPLLSSPPTNTASPEFLPPYSSAHQSRQSKPQIL